jgi:hypothetical protein
MSTAPHDEETRLIIEQLTYEADSAGSGSRAVA